MEVGGKEGGEGKRGECRVETFSRRSFSEHSFSTGSITQPRPPLRASSLLESFELPDNTHTTLKVTDTWRGSAKKIRVAKKTLDETAPALFLSCSLEMTSSAGCPVGGPPPSLVLFASQASLRSRARPVPFCQLLSTRLVRRYYRRLLIQSSTGMTPQKAEGANDV